MTEIELKKAREDYYCNIAAQRKLLECMNNYYAVESFSENYLDVTKKRIEDITRDTILQRTFLSAFQNTQESSPIFIYLNDILRTDATIDDGRPELESVDWTLPHPIVPEGLNCYFLYCNLETNNPVLIKEENFGEFITNNITICLPQYRMQNEIYRYNSKSLEKITKGFAKEKYERLQLWYFKELLENSKDETLKKVRALVPFDYTTICCDK